MNYKGTTDQKTSWLVWKFGGTSVANASRLLNVANYICKQCQISSEVEKEVSLLHTASSNHIGNISIFGLSREQEYRLAVVVSAMAGITDALQSCCHEAASEFHQRRKSSKNEAYYGKPEYCQRLDGVKQQHFETVDELLLKNAIDAEDADTFKAIHEEDINKISEILKAFSLSGTCPPSLREMIMGHGELWSSRILFGIVKHRYASFIEKIKNRQVSHSDTLLSFSNELSESTEVETKSFHIENCPLETTIQPKSGGCDFCLPCPVHGGSSEVPCCRTKAVRWIDARQILVISDTASAGVYEKVTLNFATTNKNMQDWLEAHPMCRIAIITGYVCSTDTGIPTTLKRNGSDYSGSLFARLLNAKLYTVWTDIDGVYTADPRKVPTAFRLPFLSYIEAIELAYFGAKVLHPLTMEPCISVNIPIVLKSSLKPESPGTLIGVSLPKSPITTPNHQQSRTYSNALQEEPKLPNSLSPSSLSLTKLDPADKKKAKSGFCKAFTLIDNISLINVAGTSMIGVPGIASRLFGAVHESNCSVVMVSQASSEHSICFAVLSPQARKAKAAVEAAFYKEMRHDNSMKVYVSDNCTIICAVGERMCGALGVLGRLSTSLANAEVNIKAVTQGASETNITFVVDTAEATRAIRAMHDAIYSIEYIDCAQLKSYCHESSLTNSTLSSGLRSAHLLRSRDDSLASSDLPVARHTSTHDESIRIVFLVLVIPLPPIIEARVVQIVSDIQRRSMCPTPLEKQDLPIRIIGYTDGLVFVKKLQASEQSEVSTFSTPSPNELLYDKNGRSPLILIDLRQWMRGTILEVSTLLHSHNIFSPLSSIHMTTEELVQNQSRFLQQWMGQGRIVINSREIQVSPLLDTVLRMISLNVGHKEEGTATNGTFSFDSSSEFSTTLASSLAHSEDDAVSMQASDVKGHRRAFTAENVKF